MKRPQTLTKSDENRLLLGLVVQPFVAAALTFAIFPFIEYSDRLVNGVGRTVDPVETAFGFAIMAGVVASVATGFAYPTLLWLLERGPLTHAQTTIAGMVFGNAPFALTLLLLAAQRIRSGLTPTAENLAYGWLGLIRVAMLGSVVGLVCASVFWHIAGRHLSREHNQASLP